MDKANRQNLAKLQRIWNTQLINLLIDIYRSLNPVTAEYIFSSFYKVITRIDYQLSNKASFNTFQRTDIKYRIDSLTIVKFNHM